MFLYSEWYSNRRKLLIETFGGHCILCLSTEDLVFHHVKPTNVKGIGRGSHKRLLDIENNIYCYQLLCSKCHDEYHYKHIDD